MSLQKIQKRQLLTKPAGPKIYAVIARSLMYCIEITLSALH